MKVSRLFPLDPAAGERPGVGLLAIAAATAIISVIAERIGLRTIRLGPGALVFFPFVWSILLGSVIGLQKFRPVGAPTQLDAVRLMEIGIVLFIADLGALIGPSLTALAHQGTPLLLQEFGHVFGTVVFALPFAVALGLGRSAIGATYSIDREPNLAFMAERYGGSSAEYRGALSVYVFGSVIGAIYISLLAAYLASAHWFSPQALALGAGVGSGSMMAAGVASLARLFPAASKSLLALGAASNLITEVIGVYVTIFISLPLAEFLYRFWSRVLGKPDSEPAAGPATVDPVAMRGAPETGSLPALTLMQGTTLAILLLAIGVIMLISDGVGTGRMSGATMLGMTLLGLITFVAFRLARLVPAIPAVFWASAIPLLLTARFSPVALPLDHLFKGIDFLSMVTPVLAFVGISIGKDAAALRRAGWKFLVVSILVYTATYLSATAIAQFVVR